MEPLLATQNCVQPYKKAPEWAVGGAQIDVLAARFRHRRGEFRISQSAKQAQQACDHPDGEKNLHRADFRDHRAGNQKDAAADNGSDYDRDRAP